MAASILPAVLILRIVFDTVPVGGDAADSGIQAGTPLLQRRLMHGTIKCPLQTVRFQLKLSDLPEGWTVYYNESYKHPTTNNDTRPGRVKLALPGNFDCLLFGALQTPDANVFYMVAMADRWKFEYETQAWHEQVFWYRKPGQAAGFAGDNNVNLDPGDKGSFGSAKRLSWHLDTGYGGYRAGVNLDLDNNVEWRKVVMYGPQAALCEASICAAHEVFKPRDAPEWCKRETCTSSECCKVKGNCTTDVCGQRWLPKLQLPPYCEDTVCVRSECCDAAPTCATMQACPQWFYLKPSPEFRTCADRSCTPAECCDPSPSCASQNFQCNTGLVNIEPRPRCAGAACQASECCTDPGKCSESDCTGLKVLKPSERLPSKCKSMLCTFVECCDEKPPTVSVSNPRLADLDLDAGELGGNITWVPPAWDDTVTTFSVYLGASPGDSKLLGRVSWGTNSLVMPVDTAYAPWLYIATGNGGGEQDHPQRLAAVDVSMSARNPSFQDMDINPGKVSGRLEWSDPLAEVDGSLADICRSGRTFHVKGGGHGDPAAFFLDDVLIHEVVANGSIGVVILHKNLSAAAAVRTFDTGSSPSMAMLLDGLPDGTIILLASMGEVSAYLNSEARAAIRRFGAAEVTALQHADSFALIGAKGTVRPLSEMLVRASSGGIPARAMISCPLSHYDIYLGGLNPAANKSWIGREPAGASGHDIVMNMPSQPAVRLFVRATSALGEQSQVAMVPLRDSSVVVSDVDFNAEAEVPEEMISSGTLRWRVQLINAAPVIGFRVYLGRDALGLDKEQVVADVRADGRSVYSVRFPSATQKGNNTHLLVFAYAKLGEQSTPVNLLLSTLRMIVAASGIAATSVTVVVGGATAAASVAQAADMRALERVATKMEAVHSGSKILGTFINDDGDKVVIRASGEPPVIRALWSSFLPGCIHHHPPSITVRHFSSKAGGSKENPARKSSISSTLSSRTPTYRTVLQRHRSCDNFWDNGEWLLKKISNKRIALYGPDGKHMELVRRVPRWQFTKLISWALKVYAPVLVVVGIFALILQLSALVAVLVLIGASVLVVVLGFAAIRSKCLKQAALAIAKAPPESIRDQFWRFVGLIVGLLPSIAAFVANTPIGYMSGFFVCLATILVYRGAPRIATAIDLISGGCLALLVLIVRFTGLGSGFFGSPTQMLGVLLASTLTLIRGLNSWVESLGLLFDDTPLKQDALLVAAEQAASASEMSLHEAVVLQAFAQGPISKHMQERVIIAIERSTAALLLKARVALRLLVEELCSDASGWRRTTQSLGKRVGRTMHIVGNRSHIRALADVLNMHNVTSSLQVRNPEGQELTKKILTDRVGPWLEEVEQSLNALLSGPLGLSTIVQARGSALVLLQAATQLCSHSDVLGTCLGRHAAAGHRSLAQALSAHARRAGLVAAEVRQEMQRKRPGAMERHLARQRIVGILEFAARAKADLQALAEESESGENGYAALAARGGRAATNAKRDLELIARLLPEDPASVSASNEVILTKLDTVLKALSAVATALDGIRDAAPTGREVVDLAMVESKMEINSRWATSPKQLRLRAESVLCEARMAAGLTVAVAAEVEAATDAASKAAQLMDDACVDARRILDAVSKTRWRLGNATIEILQKLQENVSDTVAGLPVQALMQLQGLASDKAEHALRSLVNDLESMDYIEPVQRFSSLRRSSTMSKISTASWGNRPSRKTSNAWVAPAQDLREAAAAHEQHYLADVAHGPPHQNPAIELDLRVSST